MTIKEYNKIRGGEIVICQRKIEDFTIGKEYKVIDGCAGFYIRDDDSWAMRLIRIYKFFKIKR